MTGVHLSKENQVLQTPADLLVKANSEVNISLAHSINSYDTILWYQRSAGDNSLKLICYISYKNPIHEKAFEKRFRVRGDGEKKAFLHIQNLSHPQDSAMYFGVASIHSNEESDFVVQKLPEEYRR